MKFIFPGGRKIFTSEFYQLKYRQDIYDDGLTLRSTVFTYTFPACIHIGSFGKAF